MPSAPSRLTIAHVDSEMGFSGGEVQVFLLLEGLRDLGHRNVLFCQPGSRCEAECAERGLESRPVRMRNHFDLGAVRRLRRGFAAVNADLAHTNTGRDAWLGGWAAHGAGLPCVNTRRMDRRVRRGLRTRLTYGRFTRRVAAISPAVAACLREGGIEASKIVLIPEAFDPARIEAQRDRADVRTELGVGEDEILVLGLGALVRRKGFDVLLDAMGRLTPALRSNVQVRVGGEERDALRAQAASLGFEGQVRLLGRRDDVGDLLAAADVFVMPSRREGLGVASLEAMGAGLPVVASRVGGLAFGVVDGETGVLVPPEDVPALAAALESLIRDETLRVRMGRSAHRRALAQFSQATMVGAYVELYRSLLM
jgi:glycosyltransferase involved in cell wall biosynthesis